MSEQENRRAYIRHPIHIPINVVEQGGVNRDGNSVNISVGGLLFLHDKDVTIGSRLLITIPLQILKEPAVFTAQAVRSTKVEHGYEIAVAFEDEETALRSRLVQQIVRIDEYRHSRGIEDFDAAANEWIRRYSDNFPYG